MSTAVIGVFLLQVSLIVDAKRENERQFELQVQEVLNEVAEALKEKERRDQVQASISGFRTRYVQRNLLGRFSSPSALLDFNLDLLRLRDNEKELFDKLLVEPELRHSTVIMIITIVRWKSVLIRSFWIWCSTIPLPIGI